MKGGDDVGTGGTRPAPARWAAVESMMQSFMKFLGGLLVLVCASACPSAPSPGEGCEEGLLGCACAAEAQCSDGLLCMGGLCVTTDAGGSPGSPRDVVPDNDGGRTALDAGPDESSDGEAGTVEPPPTMDAAVDEPGAAEPEGGPGDATLDGGLAGESLRTIDLTLVSLFATDGSEPISRSHRVDVLDADTGLLIDPPGTVLTEAGTGQLRASVPSQQSVSLHLNGAGTDSDDLMDMVSLNHAPGDGESLFRSITVGLARVATNLADYEPMDDRAEVYGTVYWRPGGGPRVATVPGAQVFIDGAMTPADDTIAERYADISGLPAPAQRQLCTLEHGRFFIGSLGPGAHTAQVSMDGGQTFLGKPTRFVVSTTRQQAKGPYKGTAYILPIDLETDSFPEDAEGCPGPATDAGTDASADAGAPDGGADVESDAATSTDGGADPVICQDDLTCNDDDPCTVDRCEPSTANCVNSPLDADADGDPPLACGGSDCDDNDSHRYGGAPEVCDGKDNNCNGAIDAPLIPDACSQGSLCEEGLCVPENRCAVDPDAICFSTSAPDAADRCEGLRCGQDECVIAEATGPGSVCQGSAALLCDATLRDVTGACARDNAFSTDAVGDARQCMFDSPELSSVPNACIECFVERTACARDFCLVQCVAGDSPACDQCQRDNGCLVAFDACTGLPAL